MSPPPHNPPDVLARQVPSPLRPEPRPVPDPRRLAGLIEAVLQADREGEQRISLAANENRLSALARRFLGSDLANRYHLGTPADYGLDATVTKGDLMFRGLPAIYALEQAAVVASQAMFGAAAVDFRPLSGVHGMICTLAAMTEPGDCIYSIDPMHGGHFATRHIVERIGRTSRFLPWDRGRCSVDLPALRAELPATCPTAVFLDHGMALFPLPVAALRELIGSRRRLIYDASHTLGLIAGGRFQSPLAEGCDVLQGNSHKTFPGPQKAAIYFRDRAVGGQVAESLSAGFVSSQHTHHAVAHYITTLELAAFGPAYAEQVIANSLALAAALQAQGFAVLHRDGVATASHIVIVTAAPGGIGAYAACERLMQAGIDANARLYYETPVLRLGTQEVTRRGMTEADMAALARLMADAVRQSPPAAAVRRQVAGLSAGFRSVHFSFDDQQLC